MTLFRKVFQNQSRPADADETLDEDALRAAFKEMREPRPPLILDPFEHAAKSDLNLAGDKDAPSSPLARHQDTFDFADRSAAAVSAKEPAEEAEAMDEEAFEEEINALEQDLAAAPEAAECDGSAGSDTGPQGHSDDEIVANLGRALADVAPQPEPEEMNSDDDALIKEDLVEADASADPITETEADVVEAIEPQEDAIEPEGPQAAREEHDAVDAAALFAKEQMGALNLARAQSVQPEGVALPTEDLSPVADVSEDVNLAAVSTPAAGRVGRRAGRVKTRVLGFNRSPEAASDPFGATPEATATPQREKFPVGWLVIVEGPGTGHSFSIFTGASMIGRGEDQVIRLDFGDNSISRNNHAAIAYDEEQNKFYIGHGGKSNIIRRNARPVLSTEELHHADLVRIGETTLRFVALCGSDFQWNGAERADASSV